jgi:hypothetical protein
MLKLQMYGKTSVFKSLSLKEKKNHTNNNNDKAFSLFERRKGF